MPENKDRYSSNALVRGLEILRMFSAEQPTLSLLEIANKLGVNRTVPFRLLSTLQNFGYIHKDEQTKRYQLAPKVMELGFAYLSAMQLPEIAQPYLERLRDEVGASVYLSVLDGHEIVYIGHARIVGFKGIFVNTGMRFPAHATANGKLLLAYQPKEELGKLLQGKELKAFTELTKVEKSELMDQLAVIRNQGYAYTDGEFQQGVRSLAVPVFNRSGAIMAAVNVVVSETFMDREYMMNTVLPVLQETGEKLSGVVGYAY